MNANTVRFLQNMGCIRRNFASFHKPSTLLTPKSSDCIASIGTKRTIFRVETEKDRKLPPDNTPLKQQAIEGFKILKSEIKIWKEEWVEHLRSDPIMAFRPGETDVLWSFGDNDVDINSFITTSDSDNNEGYSKCTFEKSPAGYGLWTGTLDSTVPRTGEQNRAGYCNITGPRAHKSFYRESHYDWSQYNTLVMRVRGDGRPYMLNVWSEGIFDVQFYDMYQHLLYTRGGPHWQLSKIPFSKFFLSSKGTIQDRQSSMYTTRVSRFGISTFGVIDLDGPFRLEIDYIGLEYNPQHTEEFAYETYHVPKYTIDG